MIDKEQKTKFVSIMNQRKPLCQTLDAIMRSSRKATEIFQVAKAAIAKGWVIQFKRNANFRWSGSR